MRCVCVCEKVSTNDIVNLNKLNCIKNVMELIFVDLSYSVFLRPDGTNLKLFYENDEFA